MERSKRVPVTVFVKFDNVPAHSVNLSSTGALIATDQRPEIGGSHEVALMWDEITCRVTARVARHTEEGVGLEFQESTGRFKRAVTEIIEEVDRDQAKKASK